LDIFDKIKKDPGPLGQYQRDAHGYLTFPKLEGEISNRMQFRGKDVLVWSINNYLGLANNAEIRKADTQAATDWGLSYPMGARMMSGNSTLHEQFEEQLADFSQKEDAVLLNYGYQGMHSTIDALCGRNDVIIYDSEAHACITDGVRLHQGKRIVYQHNDIEKLEKFLQRAEKIVQETGGGIMVITEGVFGMSGDQGKLKEIAKLKDKYDFRLFVDDAHGIGTLGTTGAGAGEEQGVQDKIDIYFGTFAKSFASIGGFIAADEYICDYLRYNIRSQIFAKSMPMPIVVGNMKRLEMLRDTIHKDKLWKITNALQSGLRANGFDLGATDSCVTPVHLTGGPYEAGNVILDLRENHGIFCSMVIYPVVPKDIILLRLIPTAIHTLEDVEYTIDVFKKIKDKLAQGAYAKDKIVLA